MSHASVGTETGSPRREPRAADRAPRATHPVLLMNPGSGGGKATRFGLAERCRDLGRERGYPGTPEVAGALAAIETGRGGLGVAIDADGGTIERAGKVRQAGIDAGYRRRALLVWLHD